MNFQKSINLRYHSEPQFLLVVSPLTNSQKFLTGILQRYTGKNHSFLKDSKGLAYSLKGRSIISDETSVSFDASALFTGIPIHVALEVINRKLTTHITQEGTQTFLKHTQNIPKDKIIVIGTCLEQLYVLIPTQVLQRTPRISNGFPSITRYSKYLYGIF